MQMACGRHIDRFRTLDEASEQHHPVEPHVHLAFLAVAPPWWGRGAGTQLLRAHHQFLDNAAADAYLEATSDDRRLYQRHGYEDAGPPIRLPDGPTMWPMWRPAQSPGGAA